MWTSDHVKWFPGHQGDTHFQVKSDHLGNWRKGVDSTLLKFKIILWKKFYLLRIKVHLQVQPRNLDIFTIVNRPQFLPTALDTQTKFSSSRRSSASPRRVCPSLRTWEMIVKDPVKMNLKGTRDRIRAFW